MPGWNVTGLLATVLLVHAIAMWASRWPAAAAQGGPLPGVAAAPVPDVLRVGTFNIHAGKDAHGQRHLDRTAAALAGLRLDFIGLNEVSACAVWNNDNQAAALGRQLEMTSLFAPGERRYGRDWYGNGLLSRFAVSHWQRTPLPATQERGHRATLQADLDWNGTTLHFLIVHLDRRRDRAAQLKLVAGQFLQLPPPAILLGDLNSTSDDPILRQLLISGDVQDPLAQAGCDGQSRVDWILTRGMQSTAAGVVDSGASDHPACWAELRLAE
ncbi:MAG: endonuclease/exonuclease/phosphatase family protein [Pirellulales bacterium]